MKAALRRLLIYGHRYLGMALSLLFLMWFLTGIGMIYSRGMPRLTPETRLARMAPIDLDAVRFTPIEAVSKAGLIGPGPQTTLLTVLGRPAYRYDGRGTDIVFADTGERFVELELEDAIRGRRFPYCASSSTTRTRRGCISIPMSPRSSDGSTAQTASSDGSTPVCIRSIFRFFTTGARSGTRSSSSSAWAARCSAASASCSDSNASSGVSIA